MKSFCCSKTKTPTEAGAKSSGAESVEPDRVSHTPDPTKKSYAPCKSTQAAFLWLCVLADRKLRARLRLPFPAPAEQAQCADAGGQRPLCHWRGGAFIRVHNPPRRACEISKHCSLV